MPILPLIDSAIKAAGRLNMNILHQNWMGKVEENIEAADAQFSIVDADIAALQDYINTTVSAALAPLPPFMSMALGFTATSDGTNLTIALKNKLGTDPSAANPVQVSFKSSTPASAVPDIVNITAPLSIATTTGATLGTVNNLAFKLWVVLFNNGGTPVLGLWQSLTGGNSMTAFNTLPIDQLVNTTAIGAGSVSGGVFYTNGVSLVSKPYKVLGYVEYNAGLATAGSFISAPTDAALYGPGVPLPGDVIQTVFGTAVTTSGTSASIYIATPLAATITPTKASNLLRTRADFWGVTSLNGATQCRLSRNAVATSVITTSSWYNMNNASAQAIYDNTSISGLEVAGQTTSLNHTLMLRSSNAVAGSSAGGSRSGPALMTIEEVQT